MFYIKSLLVVVLLLFVPISALSYDAPVFYSDEVVVTASRHLELASESPFNISIISSREIESSGSKNIGDILRKQLGIYPKSKGFMGSEYSLSLRGSSYQQVLVLLDGVGVNSPLLGGADVGDILLSDIKRIEIVRGPVSSMYGSDAVGGVINIITKDYAGNEKLSLDAKIMEQGTNKIVTSYYGKTGDSSYGLTLGHNESPGFRDNSEYLSNNISFKLNKPIYSGEGSLLYKTYWSRKGVPGSTVFPYSDAWQTDNNDEVILTWKNDDLQTKLFNVQKLQRINLDPSSSNDEKYNSYSNGAEIQMHARINDVHNLVYGVDYKNDACDSTYAGIRSVMNGAIFLEDEYMINENAKVNYGARIDSHSTFGTNTNPRIGFLYAFQPNIKGRLVYGESFRAPTLNDLYWNSTDPLWGTVMRGNADLKPEKSKSIELGLNHQIYDNFLIDTSIYASNIENLIQWVDVSGTWATWEAQNVGKAEIAGAEFEIKYFLSPEIDLYTNYTYQQAFDSETFKYLTYRPKDQYNVGFRYSDERGRKLTSNLRYVGYRFDNTSNTNKVPEYAVFDIRYEKKNNSISYYLGAENLLDQMYEDTLNYPMPGRIYYFGIKYDL